MRVTQAQVEAVSPGNQVHASPDGRVAVILLANGNIIVSMGLDDAGKVHHVTLRDNLNGAAVSAVDRMGGPPGTVRELARQGTLWRSGRHIATLASGQSLIPGSGRGHPDCHHSG
ncbi:MAG: hypothetical protein OXB89_05400 [Anaerolineaceae bacterium]|nr:hypothetical protein [Anaerolineaceae bacterium]